MRVGFSQLRWWSKIMAGQWSREAGTQPFIDLVPIERGTGARKELFDEMERVRGPGRVSNLFKADAAFPSLAKANFQRLMVLLTQGNLSAKFKESVMTALAEANKCDYCVSFHATALRNAAGRPALAFQAMTSAAMSAAIRAARCCARHASRCSRFCARGNGRGYLASRRAARGDRGRFHRRATAAAYRARDATLNCLDRSWL
jgi:AhpD family alkylhydroperoxidase